jgi:hypothetical protein
VRYKYIQNVEGNLRKTLLYQGKEKIYFCPEELDARDFVDSFDHGYMQREGQIYA